MISAGNVGFQYNKFDFPDGLVAGVNAIAPGTLLPGLGLPAEEPYGGGFAGPLSADLLLKLDEMTVDTREPRIAELKKMDTEMLERENNKVRTYYMLNGMGVGDAQKETLWGGAVAPPAKHQLVNQKQKGQGKRARKQLEDLEVQMQGEASDSGTEGEEEAMKEAPSQKPDRPTKTPSATKDKKKDMGVWQDKAQVFLSNKDNGEKWRALLVLWWDREEAADFKGTVSTDLIRRRSTGNADDVTPCQTKTFVSKKRPKAVGDWVSRARVFMPEIKREVFGHQFWEWWADINPEWRTNQRPMIQEDGKSWASLEFRGQNGFLNVMACLKWWRDAMETPSPDWEEAVDDVTWVLGKMKGLVVPLLSLSRRH
jgi:hypothetical protein